MLVPDSSKTLVCSRPHGVTYQTTVIFTITSKITSKTLIHKRIHALQSTSYCPTVLIKPLRIHMDIKRTDGLTDRNIHKQSSHIMSVVQ